MKSPYRPEGSDSRRNRRGLEPEQPDLFAARGVPPPSPTPLDAPIAPDLETHGLDDATLIARLPLAGLSEAPVLATEAARRRLSAAIPPLEELCSRFKGFGLHHPIPEQTAALNAFAAIGGHAAAASVSRLIETSAIQGPGLILALSIAARLGARLAPEALLAALLHNAPEARTAACDCVRGGPATAVPLLIELLDDLHPTVALAAARALGRLGREEVRPRLLVALAAAPTPALIEALTPIADETVIVRLGRTARTRKDLMPAVLTALEDMEEPRAERVAAAIRGWEVSSGDGPV